MSIVDLIRADLGVEPIINAAGTKTKAGGTWLDPDVVKAMAELTDHFYVVQELAVAVGQYIASETGAEAGCVTSGAGSGMVVAAAACMAGCDPARIRQLPDTRGLRDEIVIHRVHQGQYSHMFAHAGASLVEIGHLQRTHAEELQAAISERTAAVAYLCGPGVPDTALDLGQTCRIAHERGIPVIVDAAAMIPPRANLRRFINQGADLVAISGGKVIGGPQASGLLFGRRDLIAAALANASPEHSIGRAHKISKEQIVGLYLALRNFLLRTDEQDEHVWRARSQALVNALKLPDGTVKAVLRDERDFTVPVAAIDFAANWPRSTADTLYQRLLAGNPRIFVIADSARRRLVLNPVSMRDEDVSVVAAAVSRAVAEAAPRHCNVEREPATDECPELLHAGLVRTVKRTPQAVAIRTATGETSFAELHDLALRMAALLKEIGVGCGDHVVLRLDKSLISYAALVGVLYAGATYVPLHALSPDNRIREQIALIKPTVAIFREWTDLANEMAHAADGPLLVVLDDVAPVTPGRVYVRSDLVKKTPLVAPEPAHADDVAYIMFTSGSTGRPKAVPITHGAARFFLDAMGSRYDFDGSDRFSQLFDFAFDLSVFDLFAAWDCGASICAPLPSDMLALAEYAQRFEITVWFSVPSAAALVVKRNRGRSKSIESIRWSLFCGEALPWSLVREWQEIAHQSQIENLYGPTELTIACTAYRCAASDAPEQVTQALVPIGMTWPGMTVGVSNADGDIVTDGPGRGELVVTGPQRFQGYLNDETGRNPFLRARRRDGQEISYYRTGDIVEIDEGGIIHYLGRDDTQIKLDGLRVDLAEIESVACRLAEAPLAVAIVNRDNLGLARSVTVAIEGAAHPEPNLIMKFKDHLPSSWCPVEVNFVDQIPRNGNGKVDRANLATWRAQLTASQNG